MAKLNYGVTPTSVILRLKLLNSSVTTGAGLTGLTSASAGLIIGTIKIGEAATTAYTQAGATIETITTLGTYETPTATKCRFKEVDATNHPGLYEIHLADARFAATDSLIVSVSGATNLAQCDVEVQTSNLNSNLTQILGTAVSSPATAGVLDINVKNIANVVVNTATAQIGANVVTQANIDFGVLQKTSLNTATPASVQNIPATGSGFTALGDARIANLDATISSRLAPAGTLATVTTLTGHTPQTGDSFARLGAPAGASIAADLVVIDNFVDDLETRLSTIRAGYLDNLSSGAVALEGTLTQIKQKVAGTYDRETDSLEALRDRGDAAWITATGFATAIVCTEARLAELDAANLITDVANVKTDTAAILIDTAEIGAAGAGLTVLGDARLANLDATVSTRATPSQVNTEVDTALADVNLDHLAGTAVAIPAVPAGTYIDQIMDDGTSIYDRTTNSLQAIRDRGDVAWSAAAGTPSVLIDTTIAVVTDQTHFTLTAGSDIDSAYLDQAIVMYDASNLNYPSVRKVSAYVGATKTVTLDSAPSFTIIADDGVKVFVTAPGTTAPTVGQVADGVWDELIAGHEVAGSTADTLSKNGKKADRNLVLLM